MPEVVLLNASKTKELMVDFSTNQERNYQPLMINRIPVERVDSSRYQGVHITHLLWSCQYHVEKGLAASLPSQRTLRTLKYRSDAEDFLYLHY